MEFDWINTKINFKDIPPKEIEEAFEDPFLIRILPTKNYSEKSRFFLLGQSISGKCLFIVFWSDGKKHRVIYARKMFKTEKSYYDRISAQL